MSGRVKRHISKASTSTGDFCGATNASGAMARKKRKLENVSSDDEERSFWTPKHLGDLKAYNRSASEAPAELFRKDLISAMKLADNEPLTSADYWGIADQWKQEWERGVQVPVNPDSLPEPSVRTHKDYPKANGEFRLPKRKTRVTHNDFFNNERHVLSNLPTKAEKMCRYDMDNLDDSWLKSYNGERARMGADPVPYLIFEHIVEHLEETCWENIQKLLKIEESLSIEFDEDVICDVCRSPDREEGNEMVFCDICNICVHQACYGITAIPSGSWLCRTCILGIKPNCDLCPNKGGAMKSTKSGHKWAHVACALWIPEVSIGSVERMEPITKITSIPQSRWALVCVLCRERRGACIQCSVKSCKTAYHVTCAFKHGLEMKAIIEDESTDDVKLRSYCEKHIIANKKEASDAESDCDSNPKKKNDLTSEQKNHAKAAKLRQIEAEFYNHVDALQTSTFLDIDFETTETIFYYWKLKRKAGFNKPLLTPRSLELDLLSEQPEQDIERMKMFVQLRQYLERVRNLCYMVSRREKLSKSFLKVREQTFSKQCDTLNKSNLTSQEREAVTQANHGHFIYDQLYSHPLAPVHSHKQFERIVRVIAGTKKNLLKSEDEGDKKEINGLRNFFKSNPYKKTYFNGAEQRRSRSRSISCCESTSNSSTEDSDSSLCSTKWKPPEPGIRISVFTSSEDETKPAVKPNKALEFTKIKPSGTSEDEISPKIVQTPTKVGGRGRGKRRRGRPRGSTKASVHENSIISSDDNKFNSSRESKIFDELMKTAPGSSHSSSISPIKKENQFSYSSNDDCQKKTRPRVKKTTPLKQEFLSSSEEDILTPGPKLSPSKSGKGRGRGRGRPPHNSLSSWPTPSKLSDDDDDDNLGPATYKLTSEEEEKSDKSLNNEITLRRRNLFGSSDNKSDDSDMDVVKHTKNIFSDPISRSESNDEVIESENDCNAQMKTKAAMKEFTPKLTAKVEKINHKKNSRHLLNNTIKEDPKLVRIESISTKSSDPELSLFVPQRAAAKKASELITSQNVGVSNLVTGTNSDSVSEKRTLFKTQKEVAVEVDQRPQVLLDDSSRKCTPQKTRRGRSSRERIDREDDSDSEPPKKNIFGPPEILSYVPIREAARKAAENLKGTGKTGAVMSVEEIDPFVTTPAKLKKILCKSDSKLPTVSTRLNGPKITPSKSKDLDFDNDDDIVILTPVDKKKKGDLHAEKGRSIFSESEDESSTVIPKKTMPTEKLDNLLPQKQQLFRGDIFRWDHQSSSENDDDGNKEGAVNRCRRNSALKGSKSKERKATEAGSRTSRNLNRLFGSDRQEEHETENEEPPAETRKTAPDKKLKTSDGRPEHGFQPPVAARDESRTSLQQLAGSSSSEKRLCESGLKCGSGTALGDVSNQELRSDTNASFSSRKSEELCGGERELDERYEKKEFKEESKSREIWGSVQSKRPFTPKGSKTNPEKGFKSTFECISTVDQEASSMNKVSSDICKNNINIIDNLTSPDNNSRHALDFTNKVASVDKKSKNSVELFETIVSSNNKCRNKFEPSESVASDKNRNSFEFVEENISSDRGNKSNINFTEKVIVTDKENKSLVNHTDTCNAPDNNTHNINARILTASKKGRCYLDKKEKLAAHGKIANFNMTESVKVSDKKIKSLKYVEKINATKECKFNNIEKTISQRNNSNFNFTDKETVIKRMDDIDETSDIEPEPKKSKSLDNDVENFRLLEGKVELPKDSGYKSSINTPEPNDKLETSQTHTCNDDISPEIKRNKPIESPQRAKITPIKLSTLTRKKNLEDVIEERKKIVEQNDEDRRNISGASSPTEPLYSHNPDQLRDNSIPISGPTSAANSIGSNSSAPSSFVEEWREQWVKSPQTAMDNQSYSSMAHHPGMPHLTELQYQYMENHYPDSFSMYMNQMRMVQLALLQQRYPIPKTHDKQLEEESNRQAELAVRLDRDNQVSRMNCSSRNEYQSRNRTCDIEVSKHFSSFQSAKESSNSLLTKSDGRHMAVDNLTQRLSDATVPNSITPLESHSLNNSMKVSQEERSSVYSSNMFCNSLPHNSTAVTTSSKLSSLPSVSPSSHHKPSLISATTAPVTIWNSFVHSNTKPCDTNTVSNVISSTSNTSVVSVVSVCSPIASVVHPVIVHSKKTPPTTQEISTVDTSILNSPPQKRIPIYMQEPKISKFSELKSPRSTGSSPKWLKQQEKRERKSSRGTRGKRGSSRGKRKGKTRYNCVSVPKELVGTVYDFDFEEDFDGAVPHNNTLSDLRQLREKRQSVDAQSPIMSISQNQTPTYIPEIIEQSPKKRAKEKKRSKEKTPKQDEVDEVAKILEDYRNRQYSTLQRSVHEPSPPHIGSPNEPIKHTTPPTESKLIEISNHESSNLLDERQKKEDESTLSKFTSSSVVTTFPEDKTNQLKLKIKGPYANSYISSNISAPAQEASTNPIPSSTTTTLRRMRKKELIRQYCYQEDMNPEQTDNALTSNSSNPPQLMRTGIAFPKAVASMTSIPTREDYKRYTQDDSSTTRITNSSRRRRQPRDSKLDWAVLDDKNKRNNVPAIDSSRKRPRVSKEVKSLMHESVIPVTGKIKISIGKKGPEVSQVTSSGIDLRDLDSKGKPPKKRLPEESTIMKVMSDNLKFREEIMANFDRGNSTNGEKKSKKRKTDGIGSSSPSCEGKDDSLKLVPNYGSSSKLVLKFSKNNNNNNGNSRVYDSSVPLTHPLKLRLNLANLTKGDSDSKEDNSSSRSSSKERMMPLKIKLQRRPEGYVTSKSQVEGPGPPPKPPDPHNKLLTIPINNMPQHARISDDALQKLEARLAATDGGLPFPSNSYSPVLSSVPSKISALQPVPSINDESSCR